MNVEMHEFGIAEAPEQMETTGLGPCIGVAIIHAQYGFVLHSPDLIMEYSSVTEPFFAALDARIPKSCRSGIVPVIAGGCLDTYIGTAQDQEAHESTLASRAEVLKKLAEAGFSKPNVRWAEPHEIHSLFLDIEKRIIFRETVDMRDFDSPPQIEPIRC
jgi:hypothetical protein